MAHLPAILDGNHAEEAISALKAYFSADGATWKYSGSQFEVIGHHWADSAYVNRITAADILSLSTLSVTPKVDSTFYLLSEQFQQSATSLLHQIPVDVTFIDEGSYEKYLAPGKVGYQLWDLVSSPDFKKVRTSKLLARKRPHLFPIYDKFVNAAWSFEKGDYWEHLHNSIDKDVWDLAKSYAKAAGIPSYVSPLRVIDIVVWSTQRNKA